MTTHAFQWAIVGAGPAGIAVIGKLLDQGISPKDILWVDPYFKVGDLGQHWKNVSSNTSVKLFINFLKASDSFGFDKASIDFMLNHLPPDQTCTLDQVVEPLLWITDQLQKKIHTETAFVHKMSLADRLWSLHCDSQIYQAKNVVLATGAEPEYLNNPQVQSIPFHEAIDKKRLGEVVHTHETYAVFGSSHSAIIIIQYLVDLGVKKIINFYRSPCRYAVNMGDWILFDNTGLKGHTAEWARENIDGTPPHNLVRYLATEENISTYLPQCDKAIYAVGFKPRNNIMIGENGDPMDYNPHLGIIGPGLFGFGIGYPELKSDPFGSKEYQVGMWKFMVYLNKVLPVWLKYPS